MERGRGETVLVVVAVREQEMLLDTIEQQVYILLVRCYCHSYTV